MVRRYVALADDDVADRHRLASPGDRLLQARRPERPAVRAGVRGWSGGRRSEGQPSRSTGDAARWTARRSSSRRST
jgi:hypothetical protein